MDGSHKLKNFDDDVKTIRRNLENREKSGSKSHMAVTHGDYIVEADLGNVEKIGIKTLTY